MINEQIVYTGQNRTLFYHHRIFDSIQISTTHFHNEIELTYYVKGNMDYVIDNVSVKISDGDILFINKNIPHSCFSSNEFNSYHILQFKKPHTIDTNIPYFATFFDDSYLVPYHLFSRDDPAYNEILNIFLSIYKIHQQTDIATDYAMASYQFRIISLLYQSNIFHEPTFATNTANLQRLMPIFKYIEEHFSEHISLRKLADLVNIEKTYFCRLFKSSTGKNVTDYINYVRIRKAQEYLKQGRSVTEVAFSVGFSSVSRFGQVFKAFSFCSPSSYIKILKRPASTQNNNLY